MTVWSRRLFKLRIFISTYLHLFSDAMSNSILCCSFGNEGVNRAGGAVTAKTGNAPLNTLVFLLNYRTRSAYEILG